MSAPAPKRPSKVQALLLATRPKTLVAGIVPVAVGSAVAWREHQFKPLLAFWTLVGALLIQIGTNLANDYFDFKKGADNADRLGPPRATQQGWLEPKEVFRGALFCFGLAFVVGMFLVYSSGWPILVIGITSLFAGYAYTGGPFPLAYNGLGDLFVLIFFGFVAVCGTFFVHTGRFEWTVFIASIPVGLLGVALLAVNNTRDELTDAKAGKKTLVVRFGATFGRAEYVTCIVLSAAVPPILQLTGLASVWIYMALAALPFAVPPLRIVFGQSGAALNEALANTARFQLIFGVLFAVGLSQ